MPSYATGHKPDLNGLLEGASLRGGLFTTREAEEHGVSRQLLSHHVKVGNLERIERGIYRSKFTLESPHEQILISVLASGPESSAAGPSALSVWGLGHLEPKKIFIRIPSYARLPRLPKSIGAITELIRDERTVHPVVRDGVPIEPVGSAIATTSHYTNYGPAQIGEVVKGAISKGLLGRKDLDDEWIDDEVRKHFLNA